MTHVTRWLLMGALVLGVTAVAPVMAKPEPPPPDYFPMHVGDWWKYQSTTGTGQKSEFQIKVINFDKASGVYTLETTAGATSFDEFYTRPAGLINWTKETYLSNKSTVDFSPARRFLTNPLKNGDTWSWTGTGMMGVAIDEKSTVVGSDAIVVPAGKFEGAHVHGDVTQGGSGVKKDYWYANWVGLVKSKVENASFTSTTELLDYSFKRK